MPWCSRWKENCVPLRPNISMSWWCINWRIQQVLQTCSWSVQQYGVSYTTTSFVAQAKLLTHPFSDVALDDNLLNTAFLYVTRGPIYIQHTRAEFVEKWKRCAFVLRQSEASLHAVVNEKVEKVLHKQQLLVLSALLEDLHFPHHQRLVDLIKTDFPLLDTLTKRHIFITRDPSYVTPFQDFIARAPFLQYACKQPTRASDDHELDSEMFGTDFFECIVSSMIFMIFRNRAIFLDSLIM